MYGKEKKNQNTKIDRSQTTKNSTNTNQSKKFTPKLFFASAAKGANSNSDTIDTAANIKSLM